MIAIVADVVVCSLLFDFIIFIFYCYHFVVHTKLTTDTTLVTCIVIEQIMSGIQATIITVRVAFFNAMLTHPEHQSRGRRRVSH